MRLVSLNDWLREKKPKTVPRIASAHTHNQRQDWSRSAEVEIMLNKPRWDLRSRWTLRQQRPTAKNCLAYLFEHEVTVSSASSNVEVVARFVHALPDQARRPPFGRGGLVSLVIRSRCQRRRIGGLKRIDARALAGKLLQPTRLKAIDS